MKRHIKTFAATLLLWHSLLNVAAAQDSISYWSQLKTPLYHSGDLIPASQGDRLVTVELSSNQAYKVVPAVVTWTVSQVFESTASAFTYKGWQVVQPQSGQDKFSARDFAWIPAPDGTQTAVINLTVVENSRIAFWSEHSAEHMPYTLTLRTGAQVKNTVTLDPRKGTAATDHARNSPSWYSPVLQAGDYRLEIFPAGQMVIDKVIVEKMTY